MTVHLPEAKNENQALTEKEMMFVERYLTHWNSARAAREAGYCEDNPDNAKIAGMEIRRKPYIKNAIDQRMRAVCMDANEALARLADIARGDIGDFLTQDKRGNWTIDIDKAKREGKTHLIESYTISRFDQANIKLYSSVDALDKIARHLNLFKDENKDVSMSLSAWAKFVEAARQQPPPPDNANVKNPAFVVDSVFVDEDRDTIEFDVNKPSNDEDDE